MAKQTICYRSDAGNDFPTEHEALKDDLRHFIFNVIKNEASARQITDAMIDALDVRRTERPADWPETKGFVPETIWPGLPALIDRLAKTRPDQTAQLPYSKPGIDLRPDNCRNKLKDMGKPYPKSGCAVTGCQGAFAARCIHKNDLA